MGHEALPGHTCNPPSFLLPSFLLPSQIILTHKGINTLGFGMWADILLFYKEGFHKKRTNVSLKDR